MRSITYTLLLISIILAAIPVFAQDIDTSAITDDQVNAVAENMFCLECENIPLDVCGTQACKQWRDEIRIQLAEGRTEAQILEYFRVNHGEQALAAPGDPFLRNLTNITPYVFALLAVIGGFFVISRWQGNNTAQNQTVSVTPPTDETDDYLSQLEQDLRNQ